MFKLIVAVAVAAPLALASTAVAAPSPPGLGKPTKTARFKLVVEGRAFADQNLSADGNNGLCDTSIRSYIKEFADYERGTGVAMEFDQYGAKGATFLSRAGRRVGDTSFAVRVRILRNAEGFYRRRNIGPPEACPPLDFDVSKHPDCFKDFTGSADLALQYVATTGKLSASLLGRSVLGNANPAEKCSTAPDGFDLGGIPYSWPGGSGTSGSLSTKDIFGRRKTLVITLGSRDRRDRHEVNYSGVKGIAIDTASNRVTLRFIRQ
jgi:hypothetical protein